jgi:hypothetical protein
MSNESFYQSQQAFHIQKKIVIPSAGNLIHWNKKLKFKEREKKTFSILGLLLFHFSGKLETFLWFMILVEIISKRASSAAEQLKDSITFQ